MAATTVTDVSGLPDASVPPSASASAPTEPATGPTGARTIPGPRWLLPVIVAALVLLHALLASTSILTKSQTYDELAHLAAGYSYWLFHDYRLQPENGLLPQRLIGLPSLASDAVFPATDGKAWHESDVWLLGHRFLYESGNDADRIIFRARLMIVLLSCGLAVAVFACSRRLFGDWGGLLSLTVYALSPTVLAHARLATSDMAAAMTMTIAVAVAWRMIHRLNWWTLLGGGVALAAMMLAKYSGVLLVPVVLALVALRVVRGLPLEVRLAPIVSRDVAGRIGQASALVGALLVQTVLVVALIWASYGFRYATFASAEPGRDRYFRPWEAQLEHSPAAAAVVGFARDRQLLPEAYLYGFSHVLGQSQSRRAFLNGEYSATGWWYFFPYTFLVKTALAVFVLLPLAGVALWRWRGRWGGGRQVLYELSPWLVFIAVYGAAAINSNLNIGHRHILPIYPALFIMMGAAAWWLTHPQRLVRALPVVAVAALAFESLFIWPHYLAYFNVFAGGPAQGYRHLVDSSLDWGQDLPGLRDWLEANDLLDQDHTPVYLSYFGTASPSYYGIEARRLESHYPADVTTLSTEPLTGGYYCISASMLQRLYTRYWGQWCEPYERRYWDLARFYHEHYLPAKNSPEALKALVEQLEGADKLEQLLGEHEQLRFARLCEYLQHREPEAMVGYSILIYRVTRDELQEALLGPPVELHETPGIRDERR